MILNRFSAFCNLITILLTRLYKGKSLYPHLSFPPETPTVNRAENLILFHSCSYFSIKLYCYISCFKWQKSHYKKNVLMYWEQTDIHQHSRHSNFLLRYFPFELYSKSSSHFNTRNRICVESREFYMDIYLLNKTWLLNFLCVISIAQFLLNIIMFLLSYQSLLIGFGVISAHIKFRVYSGSIPRDHSWWWCQASNLCWRKK